MDYDIETLESCPVGPSKRRRPTFDEQIQKMPVKSR